MSVNPPAYPNTPARWLVLTLIALALGFWLIGLWSAPVVSSTWERLFPRDPGAAADDDGPTVWYQSQMHPWVIQPYPGTCPICGMDLTPVDPARFGAEVTVSPITVQNIGISSQAAFTAPLTRTLRTVGTVDYDPGRIHSIPIRSAAWIENMSVRAVGDRVQAGDHLFDLRSQELYAAQVEYLGARDEGMRQTIRRRLAFLGMFDTSLLDGRDQPLERVPVSAPVDGVVIARQAEEGQRLNPGTTALRIADDRSMWLRVTLFEHQVSGLDSGMPVHLRTRSGQEMEGEISVVEPILDGQSRSLVARVVVDNAKGRLRQGDYANVHIPMTTSQDALLVPRSAVVSSGRHHRVFIDLGRGRFAPREVQLGLEDDNSMVEIRDGLAEGERVVVSGQYLIDAESRMIEAIARQVFPDREPAQAPPQTSAPSDAGADGPWTPLLQAYSDILEALYADDREAVAAPLEELIQALDAIDDLPQALADAIEALRESEELSQMRRAAGAMGIALRDAAQAQPRAETAGWTVFYCGMADAPEDGVWLQDDADEARNPFFGARHGMRACHIRSEDLPAPETNGDDAVAEDGLATAFASAYADLAMALYAEESADISEAIAALAQATPDQGPVHTATQELADQDELADQRRAFGALSIALRDHAVDDAAFAGWTVFYCGMADAPEDGVWLQDDADEARNPFFGARHGMRACHVNAHGMGEQE